ncbi:MAG: hypothetical protein AAB262_09165 [Elusimicrobiota bacterium]
MRAIFRPLLPTDRRFIAATWSMHWWRPAECALLLRSAWRSAVFNSVLWVLDRPGVNVLVVADADAVAGDADVFGYLVTYEPVGEPVPLVLFLFVKDGARRVGLATQLLRRVGLEPDSPITYACHTPTAAVLHEAGKFPLAQWRPELARLISPREDRDDADLAADQHHDHEAPGHAEAGAGSYTRRRR